MFESIKSDFPVFAHHPNLVFLDSAASSQKPKSVLDTVRKFSEQSYANIHRGNYALSLQATEQFEATRNSVAAFFGTSAQNIAFTKNGTESSNIIANGAEENILTEKSEVIITVAEHHANMLPWVRACKKTGANLKYIYPDSNGVFSIDDFEKNITSKTTIVAFPHVSNVTGQVFPVTEIVSLAKKHSAITVLDACQSAPHIPFQFDRLGVDAAFITGHKLGAGGTGVLFLKTSIQDKMPPLLVGGDIVLDVTENSYQLISPPSVYESGTPAIENIIGLQASVEYLKKIGGMEKIELHEKALLKYGLEQVQKYLPDWKIIGPDTANNRSGNISLTHSKIHHSDMGMILADKNICVRSGFHCANPLHHFLKCTGSVRASFWVYNSQQDIDSWIEGMIEAENMLTL